MEMVVAALVVGILVLVLAAVALVGAVVVGLWWSRRRKHRVDPEARSAALREIGFSPAGEGRWSFPVEDTALVFEDGPNGWRWIVRLPRYNTMSLTVEERSAVDPAAVRGAFPSGIPAIDARFVLGSPLAARTAPLVRKGPVPGAMLAVPHLSLQLGADELAISDPELKNLAALAGSAAPGTAAAVVAEKEIHQAVQVLVLQVFRSLYARDTGTIMDEFR